MDLRQDFKTPVKNQLGIGVRALDVFDEIGHARNLLLLRLWRFGDQIK